MSIRLRLACIVALTAAALVTAAGFGLTAELRSGIVATLQDSLRNSAARVARDLGGGALPLDRGSGHLSLARDQTVVQVLAPGGQLEYSTEAAGQLGLLSRAELAIARLRPSFLKVTRPSWHNPRIVLAEPVVGGRGEVMLVGASLDEVDHSIALLERGLALGGPLVVIVAGLGGWLIAGRALRPVERLRVAAEALSGSDPASELAVPGTRDELERLAKTLNGLLGRLHGALAEQKAFVAAASHELGTPLAAVRAELEVARMADATDAERRQALEVIASRVDQIVRLTRDLLLLAVGDERATSLHLVAQSIEPLVAESLRGFRSRADALGVALVLDADPGVACAVDAEHFRRVIDNLVANALAHAAGSPVVEVRVRREAESALIEVRDAGPGFPEWFLPRAFDRFSRAEESRPGGQAGAGLGLAIVRTLVEAHGGSVTASNRAEGGAAVLVVLAAHRDRWSEAAAPGHEGARTAAGSDPPGRAGTTGGASSTTDGSARPGAPGIETRRRECVSL